MWVRAPPHSFKQDTVYAVLAQWLERLPVEQRVMGSIPLCRATFFEKQIFTSAG